MLALNDKMRGSFRSQADLLSILTQLTKLVPEWISVKEIGTAGKFVKCSNQTVTGVHVQESIKLKLSSSTIN